MFGYVDTSKIANRCATREEAEAYYGKGWPLMDRAFPPEPKLTLAVRSAADMEQRVEECITLAGVRAFVGADAAHTDPDCGRCWGNCVLAEVVRGLK